MNLYILLVAITALFVGQTDAQDIDNNTVHIFLLMIPESKVESLRRRAARQEEGVGAIGAIAEAVGPAANVGQILSGILGGDLRPIFAGSTAFIPDGDFREGITEILQQTVAPGIQRILMEFNKNVQAHFNATTTTPFPIQQQQQPINNPNANNQFQQQQNFNNYNNPYQQTGGFQQQSNFNQFQQPPSQQFGGGIGGVGGGAGAGIGGTGTAGGANFNNQYNQNFQQNQLYQQQNYPNNHLQQPAFSNNQIGNNQYNPRPQNNFPPPSYNQYQQQQSPIINNNNQGSLQNSRPPFGNQIQTNIPPPVAPQQQHQFQPPPQAFPQAINSNSLSSQQIQQYIPRASANEK